MTLMDIVIKPFKDFDPALRAKIYELRIRDDSIGGSIIESRLNNTRILNICVVAFVGGDPVGLCLLNHSRYLGTFGTNQIEFNVYVKRGYRNCGIGTEIMRRGRVYAKKRWPRKTAEYYLYASDKLTGIWDRHPEIR
jgi:GNAT superfamily N-acetyltransferase